MSAINTNISDATLLADARAAIASPGLLERGPSWRPARRQPQPRPQNREFFRYLPAAAGADPDATQLLGVGRSAVQPGVAYPPANHPRMYSYKWSTGRVLPEHQVLLLTDAAGEFESDATGRVSLSGDVVLFLFPGVWHRYRPLPGRGWGERWLSFEGGAVRRRLAAAGVTPANAVLQPQQPDRIAGLFDHLIDRVKESPASGAGVAAGVTLRLLSEAIRQTRNVNLHLEAVMTSRSEDVHDEVVQQALEIIWNEHHSPPLGVADVAKRLPVTRRTLDRRFSDSLGRSVLEEINACRFARAKRLLVETDLPVKAVVYLAGFPSRERMRIMFLEREGVPPSEYREQVKENRE